MKCSLPGCNLDTMMHDVHRTDLGYCSDVHRVKAEERSLVRRIRQEGGGQHGERDEKAHLLAVYPPPTQARVLDDD